MNNTDYHLPVILDISTTLLITPGSSLASPDAIFIIYFAPVRIEPASSSLYKTCPIVQEGSKCEDNGKWRF
jgi:hypothetical protein